MDVILIPFLHFYECYEFWLALVENNNHYVHFSDSLFDKRNNEQFGPINNLQDITKSTWNPCISKFLLMSRNYQRPTIIKDESMTIDKIFYNEEKQFVFEKPILFRNMRNDVLKFNIIKV